MGSIVDKLVSALFGAIAAVIVTYVISSTGVFAQSQFNALLQSWVKDNIIFFSSEQLECPEGWVTIGTLTIRGDPGNASQTQQHLSRIEMDGEDPHYRLYGCKK